MAISPRLIVLAGLTSISTIAAAPMKGFVILADTADAYASPASDATIGELATLGVESVEIAILWYMDSCLNGTLIVEGPNSPTTASLLHVIGTARSYGMKVVLKPMLACYDHSWSGFIGSQYTTEAQWADWWGNYTAFLTPFASLAEAYKMDYFSLGTELDSTYNRSAEWHQLIATVRKLYSGPLWYGANHDTPGPDAVPFWAALDYIGVDAYYPLSATPDANVSSLVAAWQPVIANLTALSNKYNKPIIFAEIGYASWRYAAVEPYSCCFGPVDLTAQANLYTAFFQAVWDQPWMAGTYWFAWDASNDIGVHCSTNYEVAAKPVEAVIAEYYGGSVPVPPAATIRSGAAPLVVYSNGTTTCSDNSYDAIVNLQSTDAPFPGHVFSASANIAFNGAMVLQAASVFDLTPYASLQLDVTISNTSTSSYITAFLCVCDDCSSGGCMLPSVQLVEYTSPITCTLPTAWGSGGHVTVPLTALTGNNASALPHVRSLSISPQEPGVNGTIQIDNIMFV